MKARNVRVYDCNGTLRVYFSTDDINAATASDVGWELEVKARYIEVVAPSGAARVLKSADGPCGKLRKSTEHIRTLGVA